MNELKLYLETLAKKTTWYDDEDFSPSDYSGGNYDDAYSGGCDDGEVALARELLTKYFGG